MFCPKCHGKMSCKQTRYISRENTNRRRYHCESCGHRATTKEAMIFSDSGAIKDRVVCGSRNSLMKVKAIKRGVPA